GSGHGRQACRPSHYRTRRDVDADVRADGGGGQGPRRVRLVSGAAMVATPGRLNRLTGLAAHCRPSPWPTAVSDQPKRLWCGRVATARETFGASPLVRVVVCHSGPLLFLPFVLITPIPAAIKRRYAQRGGPVAAGESGAPEPRSYFGVA